MVSCVLRLVVDLWVIMLVCAVKHDQSDVENFDVDLNDILSADLMPAALFFRQEFEEETNQSFPEIPVKGDFGKAYKLMGFHRKMMNEYQCNNFIAKEILSKISPGLSSSLSRRLGTSKSEDEYSNYDNSTKIMRLPKMIQNEELLYDDGSNGYKEWLSKTTTLEDIYRQFLTNNPTSVASTANKTNQERNLHGSRRTSQHLNNSPQLDYPDADMAGYAIHPNPMQQLPVEDYRGEYPPMQSSTVEYTLPMPYPTAGNKNGYYPSGHEAIEDGYNYGAPNYGHNNNNAINEKPSKALGIKEVMEIAMTTLAFLSFGMFILQVLMCITMDTTNNVAMTPMEAGGGGEVEELRRKKRSNFEIERLEKINEIARRVILSMDAIVHVRQDDGECLLRVLCDNNKFSRDLEDNQKMWIPVWGLGLSWMSSRMARANIPTNIRLASLKASVFGLGKANCSKTYSKCDYEKMAEFRREHQELVYIENAKERWSL